MSHPRTHPRRKIVAIMAADVAGYSRLMSRDEEGTYNALKAHLNELFVPTIEEYEGRAFKFIGDGVLSEFPSAVDALNCAAAVQAGMAERNQDVPKQARLEFRIGLHVGDVIEQDGDLFGDGVNTAARVEGTAEPGGINVSSFVFESVRKKVPLEFEDLGEHMFKSFEEAVRVYKIKGFLKPRTELRAGETRARIEPGTKLNGIYEIDQLLAVGSTSEVYRARAVATGDTVIIKALSPRLLDNANGIAEVSAQASALYKLQHDGIARTYLFSVDEAVGQPYLAMEAVDGISLLDRVRHEPLTVEEADILRARLASALAEAHAVGIVHRDLVPENVILPEGDVSRAKLIEFQLDGARPIAEKTVIATGLELRYPFQSPEQLGHFGGVVGPRSDIYGLGLLIAFALKGEPLDANVSFVELMERRKTAPDLSGLPGASVPLLRALLQPDPEDRPASMKELVRPDLRTLPTLSQRKGETSGKSRRRAPLLFAAGVVGLALIGSGVWSALQAPGDGSDGEETVAAVMNPDASDAARAEPGMSGEDGLDDQAGGPDGSPPPMVAATGDEASEAASAAPSDAGPVQTVRSEPSAGPASTTAVRNRLLRNANLSVLDGRGAADPSLASIGQLVDSLNTPPCFFASIDNASPTALSVNMYAPEADLIYEAYRRLKNALTMDPTVTGRLVSDGQCAAVDFAQLGASTSPLNLELSSQTIDEGQYLDGTIRDLPAAQLILLAIDPLGRVYDLTDGVQPGPEGLKLLLDVNRPESGTVTNLLLAVSVDGAARLPRPGQGTQAALYLPALAEALAARNQPLAIRLSHFVLRS